MADQVFFWTSPINFYFTGGLGAIAAPVLALDISVRLGAVAYADTENSAEDRRGERGSALALPHHLAI